MAKSKKKGSKDEVVINLDNAGVPIAILVSGVLIAAVIFFASRNNAPVTTDVGGDAVVPTADESIDELPSSGAVTLGDAPFLGNPDTATVAIVEFSDYQCGFCQRHADETFPSIKENYIDTGKILYVFKEFPLSGVGQLGYSIAEGGVCLHKMSDSETFLEYHKGAFSLTTVDGIVDFAVELGVNESEFRTCLEEGTYRDVIEARTAEGRNAGISGTPGFIVGPINDDGSVEGRLIAGAYPYETFAEAIEELLK